MMHVMNRQVRISETSAGILEGIQADHLKQFGNKPSMSALADMVITTGSGGLRKKLNLTPNEKSKTTKGRS